MSRAALGVLALVLGLAAPARAAPLGPAAGAPRLRLCCALGHDLGLRVGPLRAPIAFDNLADPAELGRHDYSARRALGERLGLVLSCRGGLIDLAHVRAAADHAAFLHRALRGRLGRATRVPLPGDGAAITLVLEPVASATPTPALERAVAARLAYRLAVWHELATSAGGTTADFFAEAFSAASPEDLYSDLLGARLAVEALADPAPWDEAMDAALGAALRALDARPPDEARRALDAVAGRWWRPGVDIPDGGLLAVRRPDSGPRLAPWRPPAEACEGVAALELELPETDEAGAALARWARLEIRPAPVQAAALAREAVGDDELGALLAAHAGAPPEPRPEPADALEDLSGIRLLPVELWGGLRAEPAAGAGLGGLRGLGGFSVLGGHARTTAGELSIVRFHTALGPGPRGLVAHATGVHARELYLCRDPRDGGWHPPILGWFRRCEGGWLGLGGKLAQVQYDGGTQRAVLRPLELNLLVEPLDGAGTAAFLRRHLALFAGLALEHRGGPGLEAALALRPHAGLLGALRSRDGRWEGELFFDARLNALAIDDYGLEAGLRLAHRVWLRTSAAGAGRRPPLQAILRIGLELGAARWAVPAASISDWILPLVSDRRPDSLHAVLSVGFSWERFRI